MRPYIVRHLLGIGAAAAVVVAIWWGWPHYGGVAQTRDTTDNDVLTVGQCIEAGASVGPLEEALIKEDIIEKDLLQTEVTNVMCKDMLEPVTDGTLVRKLTAAQNYIQEIKLIEGAMREAAGEAAARGTDWHPSSDRPLILFRAIAQTGEQVPAQAQYGGNGGVPPRTQQAGAAANVGEDDDASIPEMLRQKEAALKREGASEPEARAGALCGTEVQVLDDEVKSIEGLYEIIPLIPRVIGHRETEQAGLLVSPLTKKRFQEIRNKHEDIDEASASDIGCVQLADRMKAKLIAFDLEALDVSGHQPDDIRELSSNRATRWGWNLTARQRGSVDLILDLSYAISREGLEFRLIPQSPVYEDAIRVQEPPPPPWWQRIFEAILSFLERISGVSGT
jgi:hypothetical protein